MPNSVKLDAVVGGQFGSEGKGHICAWLVPEYDLLFRVGGPNAGHTVVADNGASYVARHLPSGVDKSDALVVIGPGSIIDADILTREIEIHSLNESRLIIDETALLVEDCDREIDRKSFANISTTGSGASSARVRQIVARSGALRLRFAKDDKRLHSFCADSVTLVRSLAEDGQISKALIEGTQGTGLSLYHGSFPYVTARDTTVGTLLAEAGLPWSLLRRVILVCRRYPIRVGGTSGPLEEELDWGAIEQRAGVSATTFSRTELGSVSGRPRRVGEFNTARVSRAIHLNGATDIALTCVDQVSASNRDIRDFGSLDATAVGFIHHLEEITRVPVSLISTGPNVSSIIDRRKWRQGTISGLDTDLSTTRSIGFHLNKDAVMSESNSQIGNRYPLTRIVALSGPVGAGKTTVAKALMERDNVVCLRTHDLIRINADRNGVDLPSERRALQQYGDLLDQQTNGAWVADGVIHFIGQCRDAGHLVIVIDSIRRLSQLDGVRAVFQRVDHIHLTAPDFALEQRYRRRGSSSGLIELSGYAEVALNETESGIDSLSDVAKIVIDTNAYGPKQVVCLTSAAINLRGPGGLRLSGGNQKDH